MEFRKPKGKRGGVILEGGTLKCEDTPVVGVFNGFHVVISDRQSMNRIYREGNFGKGNLSKSHPHYNLKLDDIPKLIWEDQFRNESKFTSGFINSSGIYINNWNHDLQLSSASITNLFHHAIENPHLSASDSWKKINKKETTAKNLSGKAISSNLLSFKSGDSNVDVEFSNFVNGILERRELKEVNCSASPSENLVIVLKCDSNFTSSDMSLCNISARLENMPFPILESLTLNLEEAFYLCFGRGLLKIVDQQNQELKASDIWEKFSYLEKNFFERYVAYHYYRCKGWVVLSGLKYGGDYLLYKDGPSFNHASYVVKIISHNKKNTWNEFLATNRLVETFNKDVLFCMVLRKRSLTQGASLHEQLANCEVLELLSRRGLPTKDR